VGGSVSSSLPSPSVSQFSLQERVQQRRRTCIQQIEMELPHGRPAQTGGRARLTKALCARGHSVLRACRLARLASTQTRIRSSRSSRACRRTQRALLTHVLQGLGILLGLLTKQAQFRGCKSVNGQAERSTALLRCSPSGNDCLRTASRRLAARSRKTSAKA
jgi:hypothetical protein